MADIEDFNTENLNYEAEVPDISTEGGEAEAEMEVSKYLQVSSRYYIENEKYGYFIEMYIRSHMWSVSSGNWTVKGGIKGASPVSCIWSHKVGGYYFYYFIYIRVMHQP